MDRRTVLAGRLDSDDATVQRSGLKVNYTAKRIKLTAFVVVAEIDAWLLNHELKAVCSPLDEQSCVPRVIVYKNLFSHAHEQHMRSEALTARLFSYIILWGPPGTGKTTLAMRKRFSRAVIAKTRLNPTSRPSLPCWWTKLSCCPLLSFLVSIKEL